jgi:hypothetical protein
VHSAPEMSTAVRNPAASPATPSAVIVSTVGDDQPSTGASMNANVTPDRNTATLGANPHFGYSFRSRSVRTISTTSATVSWRPQSR